MQNLIISLLNGIVFAAYCYYVGYTILHKKQISTKRIILACIPFIVYYCVLCLFDYIYAVFFSGICAFLFIRIIFHENMFVSVFISLLIHSLKIVNKIVLLTILNDNSILLINTYRTFSWYNVYITLITSIISLVLVILLRFKIRKIIKYVLSLKKRNLVLLGTIFINFVLIIIYQPPKDITSLKIVTDFAMLYTIVGIGIYGISNERKLESLIDHYNEIFEYSKSNGELLAHYKMRVHESKNRLIMIKSMLDGPKAKTEKYINNILKEKCNNKDCNNHWLVELRHIPFTFAGIRNFINYKLMKLRDLGAEIEIFVCSELEDLEGKLFEDIEYNQLTTILGVIMDNMIESIREIEQKLVSINIYIEDGKIHGEFVNTYQGEIDLSRLPEVGYSTKGDQHGVGLALVAKITESNDRFECTPKIMDNFFIQHVTLKLKEKSNLK